MRVLVISIVVIFIAAGVVLGALNGELVTYDLVFARMQLPKGAGLLGALVIGWLLGGLVAWLGMSSRSRRVPRSSNSGSDTSVPRRP
jgi:putative membrane protein